MGKLYCSCCGALNCLQSPLLLLMRLYWGWGFVMAGKGKFADPEKVIGFFTSLGIPWPHYTVYFVATVEVVGGLLLLVGLFSRLAGAFLATTMIVAYATAHLDVTRLIFTEPSKFVAEAPFLFLLASLLVMAFGPGGFSIDRLLKRKCGAPCAPNSCAPCPPKK